MGTEGKKLLHTGRADHKDDLGYVLWSDALAVEEGKRTCQVLCRSCHHQKTQAWFERKLQARRAKLALGQPVDFDDSDAD